MRRRELLLLLGSAMAAPGALRAQQRAMPVIGYLNGTTPEANAPQLAAFRQGLSETGWVEGQNLKIEYRWAEFHYDRLPGLAADLVSHNVDVIAACGGADEAFVAKDATSTIPTVFNTGADPVETGLAASLARPGGNLTGVTTLTQLLWQKRVELIAELVPQTRVIGVLVNPNRALVERVIDSTQQAVNAKGLQLEILKASTEAEIDAEFATAVQRQIGAVVVWICPVLVERHWAFDDRFFELRRACEVESRMAPDGIVEPVDVAANGLVGFLASVKDGPPDELGFQGLEERLHHGVVVAISLAGHRDQDAVLTELGLIVDRAILLDDPNGGSVLLPDGAWSGLCAERREPGPHAAGRLLPSRRPGGRTGR
jgi:putative tryptophan/tyrosine transport system substrate-binding protein